MHLGILNPPTVAPPVTEAKFTITSGFFYAKFAHPTAGTRKAVGVLFQKQNRGAGLFIGSTQSGQIDLTPQP